MTLAATNVGVSIAEAEILMGATIEVVPGAVTALVGPNGSGKSTLLRTLAGELSPARGSVTMDGRALVERSTVERARRRAVLGQNLEIAFPLTAIEVAMLGRLPHSRGAETLDDYVIVRSALRSTGVSHLAERCYASLSGGEKQRVQLARALAQVWENDREPRYLLLDEPTASLDLVHQHVCLRLARRAAARGAGVLVVLHDLSLAVHYADRIVVLRGGRTVATGAPTEVLTPRLLREVFGVVARLALHPRSRRPFLLFERALIEKARSGAARRSPRREAAPPAHAQDERRAEETASR